MPHSNTWFVNHRGLPTERMLHACEWHCYVNNLNPDHVNVFKARDMNARQPSASMATTN